MDLVDAVICMALAAKIYGTDEAVKAAAKRAGKRVSKKERQSVNKIYNSRSPLAAILEVLRRY